MYSIGAFSHLSGLSVKALRYYHSEQLLVPANVDEESGYRYYAPQQLRKAAIIRAMRASGVSVADIRRALETEDADLANSVLSAHIDRVAQQRLREDEALRHARQIIDRAQNTVDVQVIHSAEQPFVGRVVRSGDESGGRAETATVDLLDRLRDKGTPPTGAWWMTATEGETSDQVEIVFCWPVETLPAEEWLKTGETVGVLPAREELVCSWELREGDEDAALALAGLADALVDRGIDPEVAIMRHSIDVESGRGRIAVTLREEADAG